MAVFYAWLGCSTLSGFGLPLFTKLCEQPEASVAWPLFEERFGVILSPPWCSLSRWTGMRLGMAWFGYCSPKCPIGRSVEFPWRVTSRVTHVTMVLREGTRRCILLPCLWPACLLLLRQLSWWLFQQVPFYTFGYLPMMSRATWINRIGVVLHLLLVPVTQTAFQFGYWIWILFPKVSNRKQTFWEYGREIWASGSAFMHLTFMHLSASLFDHNHSLHHITSDSVPFLYFSYLIFFPGHQRVLVFLTQWSFISEPLLQSGSWCMWKCGCACRGKIMHRTEESNKIIVFVERSLFV